MRRLFLPAGPGITGCRHRLSSRLTADYSFGDWEFDESIVGFFAQYAAIVGLYAVLTHYGLRIFWQR